MSESTVKLYKLAVKQFDGFRASYGLNLLWPPPLDHVINFIAYLSSKSYSSSTAHSYISDISFYVKINNWADITDCFLVRKMLKGFQKNRPTKDTRAPITIDILKALPRALQSVCSSNYEALLFSTIFSVAYFGFLRLGKLALTSGNNDHSRVLNLCDLKLGQTSCEISIRYSKTDQYGNGTEIVVSSSEFSEVCPVNLLTKYISFRPKGPGPLFWHFDKKPVTKYQISALLRSSVKFLGIKMIALRVIHSG